MRKLGWVVVVFAILLTVPASAAPKPDQYTEKFYVVSASTTPSTGHCYMTLKNGNANYDVVGGNALQRCSVFNPGQTLLGRFHKYGMQGIEILGTDKDGKAKTFWYVINNVNYLPPS
jgi:hypothetical protein